MPIILLLVLLHLGVQGADRGAGARYAGGTVAVLEEGCDGNIDTTDEMFLTFRGGKRQVNVAWTKVNLLEYGQNVNRRLGLAMAISPLFLLSKARKHFLTVGYSDEAGKQQAMVFQVDKSNIRAVLVALEARTGLKVEFQDAEARKAGKG